MGGGIDNSNNPPFVFGAISGQGGGRVMPATMGGFSEFIYHSRSSNYPDNATTDVRPNIPYGSNYDTVWGSRGGGSSQDGESDGAALVTFSTSVPPWLTYAGGGGGWGAAGGNGAHRVNPTNTTANANLGAAGGKAINTNGHAITWTGGQGSDRVFGAVA